MSEKWDFNDPPSKEDLARLQAYADRLKREHEHKRDLGLCQGCAAQFLLGGENAEVRGDESEEVYRICFWCLAEEDRDPVTGEFPPSRYHYGRC